MNNNSRRKYMQKLYDKEEITDKKSNNSEYDYFMGKNNPPEFYDPYQVIQLSKFNKLWCEIFSLCNSCYKLLAIATIP